MKAESLAVSASRAKARWLKRVMFESQATNAQKCFAYIVFDHLNCVTLDCWPNQERIAQLLGKNCTKSAQRAAKGLQALGLLLIRSGSDGKHHYAPIFLASDWNKNDGTGGQTRPHSQDNNVQESLLSNPPQESTLTTPRLTRADPAYDRRQRGRWEIALEQRLGQDGLNLLSKIATHDDAAVDRLCRALATNSLTQRDLSAARLAAEQMR